jgi:hypothetical protein
MARHKTGQMATDASGGLGESAFSRVALAFGSMFFAWLLSIVLLVVLSDTFEPGLDVWLLVAYCGCTALVSFFLFALPLTALASRRAQLDWAPLLVLGSVGFSLSVYRLLFEGWPWTRSMPGIEAFFMPGWVFGFTLCAVATYLVLLRAYEKP